MKKKPVILIFTIACCLLFGMSSSFIDKAKFYYSYNKKIYLNEVDDKLVVRFDKNKESNKNRISIYSEIADKKTEWKDDSTIVISFNPSEKSALKNRFLKQSDVKSCNHMYKTNKGLEMGITDEFVVKFKDGVTQKEIEALHNKYGVKVLKITDIFQILKAPKNSDVLEIANNYQESGLTVFSHPNFICKIELDQFIPNDSYFQKQFYLHNTGQVFTDGHSGSVDADIDAPEAWDITKGNSSIIIAVIDEGVTSGHPDLPNTRQVRLAGSNFGDGNANDPSPTQGSNDNHGNACAGIIAATQNNSQGISGIAPNCKIMPIRLKVNVYEDIAKLALALNFARLNDADIISISASIGSVDPNTLAVVNTAMLAATQYGRNGLGCVVVCSAGNTADHSINENGYVRFPANLDIPGVLTVGASDRYDHQANYSPSSNPSSPDNQIIDVVAPSSKAFSSQIPTETFEAWTIDIPSNYGYNPVHETDGEYGILPVINSKLPTSGTNYLAYTGRFGGTSCSTPEVAGVAALILSVNPNLTQQDVFDIITNTADKVGGYTYTNGRSNELGYGRLNAHRAVVNATETKRAINGSDFICSNGQYSVTNLPAGWSVVNWSVEPAGIANLSFSNNTATLTQVSAGIVTLHAYIQMAGEPYPAKTSKKVLVGAPFTPETINGFCCNGMGFYSGSSYNFSVDVIGATQYTWSVTGGTISSGQGTNTISVYTSSAPSSGSSFDVSVRAGNDCGWSGYLQRGGYIAPVIGPSSYSVYPNPASTEITVRAVNTDSKSYSALSSLSETSEITAIGSIKITDSFGRIKKLIKTGSEQSVKIDISDLPKGIYLVTINYGGKEESQKLLIE